MLSEYRKCPQCQKTKHDAMFTEGFTRHPMCHSCRAVTIGIERREKTMDWRKEVGGNAKCTDCNRAITTEGKCMVCRPYKRAYPKLILIKGGLDGQV
jgi:hypothetical protein